MYNVLICDDQPDIVNAPIILVTAKSETEDMVLGLNIAKSLMELQRGQLQLLVDGDLFKVTLVFPNA